MKNEYQITIEANILSTLDIDSIEKMLAICLLDIDNAETTLDGKNDRLEVLDYHLTKAK